VGVTKYSGISIICEMATNVPTGRSLNGEASTEVVGGTPITSRH
jgi:hypothetical protein